MTSTSGRQLDSNDLALDRSLMAADRTLMAWIRTSLSMISFGFTMFKFFQYMVQSQTVTNWKPSGALNMGTTLVILGTVLLLPATVQHWIYLRRLKKQSREKLPVSLAQIAAGLISLLGLGALANLFFHLGPF